jgi:hypothetical protein
MIQDRRRSLTGRIEDTLKMSATVFIVVEGKSGLPMTASHALDYMVE